LKICLKQYDWCTARRWPQDRTTDRQHSRSN
jgi:hypothetical protein